MFFRCLILPSIYGPPPVLQKRPKLRGDISHNSIHPFGHRPFVVNAVINYPLEGSNSSFFEVPIQRTADSVYRFHQTQTNLYFSPSRRIYLSERDCVVYFFGQHWNLERVEFNWDEGQQSSHLEDYELQDLIVSEELSHMGGSLFDSQRRLLLACAPYC